MSKNAHLVLDERTTIEVRLRERASFTEIGRELGKDPSTISKEVRLHSQTEEPQFEGQTKQKLGNSEARGAVDSVVSEQLTYFLEQNPTVNRPQIRCLKACGKGFPYFLGQCLQRTSSV